MSEQQEQPALPPAEPSLREQAEHLISYHHSREDASEMAERYAPRAIAEFCLERGVGGMHGSETIPILMALPEDIRKQVIAEIPIVAQHNETIKAVQTIVPDVYSSEMDILKRFPSINSVLEYDAQLEQDFVAKVTAENSETTEEGARTLFNRFIRYGDYTDPQNPYQKERRAYYKEVVDAINQHERGGLANIEAAAISLKFDYVGVPQEASVRQELKAIRSDLLDLHQKEEPLRKLLKGLTGIETDEFSVSLEDTTSYQSYIVQGDLEAALDKAVEDWNRHQTPETQYSKEQIRGQYEVYLQQLEEGTTLPIDRFEEMTKTANPRLYYSNQIQQIYQKADAEYGVEARCAADIAKARESAAELGYDSLEAALADDNVRRNDLERANDLLGVIAEKVKESQEHGVLGVMKSLWGNGF